MDAIANFGKHQTIDRYKTHQFVHSLFSHSLTALTCTLLYSYPYWVPSLRSSLKQLLFLSLPKMLSSFFCPKWLFIVVNVIVVYLVGESKLLGSPTYSCSSSAEIYEEYVYVERSRSFRRSSVSSRPQTTEQSKLELNLVENRYVFDDEKEEEGMLSAKDKHQVPEEEQEEEKKEKDREVEEDCEEQEEKVGEEEIGLPADELNKRVEEFIARINKQRWLEEKLLVSCMA